MDITLLGNSSLQSLPSGYFLYHFADRNLLNDTRVYHSVEDARKIAKYDSSGAYRPLKGAPNLPRGWRIELTNVDELKRALDSFYPGAIGSWLAYQNRKSASSLFTANVESANRHVSSDAQVDR